MTTIIARFLSREGKKMGITKPQNSEWVLSKLVKGSVYEITFKFGRKTEILNLEFIQPTLHDKSMIFINRIGLSEATITIPTANILDIK
jgi:hypothetical protein